MRYPTDGATGVPINTKLWTKHDGQISVVESADPAEPFQAPMEPIVTLPGELAPNTQYSVALAPQEGDAACEDGARVVFTTGSGPDATPSAPAINQATATFVAKGTGTTCDPNEDQFKVVVSISPPLVADAVAHRVYQTDGGARTLVAETMVPATPAFTIIGSSVANHYVVVAVSASDVESSDTAFVIEENASGGDSGNNDGAGCSAADRAATGSGLAGLLILAAAGLWAASRKARRECRARC